MTAHPFPVLIDRESLLVRIRELARAIAADYEDEPPLLVVVIEGARTFAHELARLLPGQPPLFEIRAASYGESTTSSGQVDVAGGDGLPCAGKQVLLLEDIVDTGRTIARLREWFLARGASGVRVASLLSKPSRRVVPVAVDYLGFEIDDCFVIGFGMDVGGRYRELPEVLVFEQSGRG